MDSGLGDRKSSRVAAALRYAEGAELRASKEANSPRPTVWARDRGQSVLCADRPVVASGCIGIRR